ncbi:MAG: hypothetical protein ACI4HK_01035 [Ruminococcus sp.]
MKPYAKIGSLLLALIIAVAAVGCTPISLKAEWAYRTDKVELPIGVYSYSLKTAYSQAKNYASKLASYDEASESWLDLEITDDDGDKAVAREWIKNEADTMCLNYIAVDNLVEELGIDMSGATADSAKKTAEEYWTVGPYASYGYYMPYKDEYEPYGVSFESFEYCTTLYNTKYSAVFEKLYGEGGSKEVKDDEYISFFAENYTDYKYIKTNLYESTADESGESTDVALSDEDAKKLTDEFDGYAKELNNGAAFDDVINKYKTANSLTEDPSTSAVENLADSSLGDELKNALGEMKANQAKTIKVGSGNTAVYYLIFKGDINSDIDSYVYDATQRDSLLAAMKKDEYKKYVDDLAKKTECEKNQSVLDQYKPELYFVKPESSASESSDSSAAN